MHIYGKAAPVQEGFMADEELHSIRRNIPFKEQEFAAIKNHAKASGTPFATYVRRAALQGLLEQAESIGRAIDTKAVELVGTIHAGDPAECRDEVRREVFCSEHPNGDSYSYLEVEGDCCNKVVPPGAIALFRRQMWRNKQLVAVRLQWPDSCELCLRRVIINKNDEFELHPDSTNPKNKPIVLCEDKERPGFIVLNPDRAEIVGVFTGDFIVRASDKK